MSRSIHHQLLWPLLLGILAITTAAGLLLYIYVRSEFLEQFDDSLSDQARSLASLVRRDERGRIRFDLEDESSPRFASGHHAAYFEVWLPDGAVLARSPSLEGHDLPCGPAVPGRPEFRNGQLPNGRPGRSITVGVHPRLEAENDSNKVNAAPTTNASAAEAVLMVLAMDRGELDEAFTAVLTALVLAALLLSAAVPLIVLLVVKRGLHPLNAVAGHAAHIDATTLASRFPNKGLPDELAPICAKLNDLLGRLDEAFQRERRFTASASHELRTPIAELRSLAEVALRSSPGSAAAAAYFQDVLDISVQMERLVAALLALARAQAAPEQTTREICDLAHLTAAAWKPLRQTAAKRRLRVDLSLPETAEVSSDRILLGAVLANVLSNAVDYTSVGGEIVCRLEKIQAAWVLDVRNTNDSLTAADLPHLGEPFWRQAPARSDHAHAGLGLALVRSYCEILGIRVQIELITGSFLRLALTVDSTNMR